MGSEEQDLTRILEEKSLGNTADLEARSKPLHELVVTERFNVDDVIAESHATAFAPHSEMIIGGRSHVYDGGFTSRITLTVSPESAGVPVRTLIFDGFSSVKAGDYIAVKIPRYEEKREESGFTQCPHDRGRAFHLEREFQSEESAIELALLSSTGHVERRDRAVGYNRFVKKE